MKTKKLKIITLLVIISTCLIIFKLHSYATSQIINDVRKFFYDTIDVKNGKKIIDNKIELAFANDKIYNQDGSIKDNKFLEKIDNNKCWSIKVYIDDNEEPFKEIVMTDEEFWSFDNARIVYSVGCIEYDSIEIFNNKYEIYLNNVEIKKSITICFKGGYHVDGENRNEISKILIPCHTKNNEVYIDDIWQSLHDNI